jgi:Na+/melibiose symporter-like transporter
MLPEILPLNVRGTAMGVAVFLHWGANFLVAQTFPLLLSGFGPGPVFLGYAVIGMLAFAFVSFFVTETKGRSLEEIEADLQEDGPGAGADAADREGRFTREPRTAPHGPAR